MNIIESRNEISILEKTLAVKNNRSKKLLNNIDMNATQHVIKVAVTCRIINIRNYFSFFVKSLPIIIFLVLLSIVSFGQTTGDYRTNNDGTWSDRNDWRRWDGDSWEIPTVGEGYPGQFVTPTLVTIQNAHNITLDVSPANNIDALTIDNGNQISDITFAGANILTVNNATTITSNSNNDYKRIFVNAGTFNTGSLSLNSNNTTTRDAYIEISTGTVNVTTDITMNNQNTTTYIRFTGAGVLNVGGNMSGGGITSALNGGATAPTSGTVEYNGAAAQQIGSYTYYNLTTSGGGTKTLVGVTAVNTILTLNSGVLQLGNNSLTISNNATDAIQGAAFDNTNMIETDGTGYVIRNAATTLPIDFPVGAGGYYSPASITAISATTGTVSVRTEQTFSLGSNYLEKFWDIITSITGKTITATFTYDPAEIPLPPTNIYVKPTAGSWQDPTGTQSFGANDFTITGTTDIINTVTSWTAGPIPGTYFSYQTGDWDDFTTWTSDPGGTTQVGSTIPDDGDKVVILTGRTVTLPSDIDTTNLEININEGGILDMATYNFTSGIAELNGQGTLRLASVNFPVAVTNTFVDAEGGTTEYYNAADFTLPAAQTTYNHLTIDAPGVVATQLSDITLNGDLHINQGTYRINDDVSTTRLILTINGDVTVDNGTFISVGNGSTNGTIDPLNIIGGTAPFLDYYENFHQVVIKGNFTNNGSVRFTNLDFPVFDEFPPLGSGSTSGAATVYFRGATDNTLTCNGTTDFYNLVLDKGVDQTFKLTIYSSAYSNFRLFGANIAGGDGGGSNPNLKKALWIRTGTLALQGLTIIPSLSEGTCAEGGADPNSDFYIPANGALLLDGTDVVVLSTADDYREVNVAYSVAGGTGLVNGVGVGGCSSFSVYGKFQVNNGYFSARESGGLITWNVASGQFVIRGGTIDAKQFRSAGAGGGLASFDQSGGTFLLRGRFQRTPTAYTSVNDFKVFTSATLNTVRANEGCLGGGTLGTFNLNEPANVFTMSGGTIRVYDVCDDDNITYPQQEVFEVNSSTGNINVTGGTLQLLPTTGSGGGPDIGIHLIKSNAALGNLTINRVSSTTTIQLNTYSLNVLSGITLSSGVLTSNNLNVTVGGNFSIAAGTTYTPGTNWTIFNGSGSQTFTVNLASALTLKKFKLDKPAGTVLTIAGTQSTINIEDSLMIVLGTLADGGKTINLTGTIATSSYLYNSGVHSGAGKIVLNDNVPQIITGDGNGIFQNIELNNSDVSVAPVSLGANTTINGTLTLSQDKLFDISTYNLKFGASATVSGVSSTRFIQSSGNAGDGGITKTYSSSSTSFVFPVGAPSTNHAAAEYSPATIAFGTNPTVFGSITVVPVGYEHPNTTTKGRSLTYFWRVKSSGFTLGTATVTHTYNYSATDNDVVTGGDITEAGYVAESYDNTTYTWTNYSADTDVDETTNTVGGTGTSFDGVSYIDGEFTAGDDDATDPFGTPTIYYSRQTGLWSNVATWSLTDHVTDNPPAVVPGAGDIVIIGGQDSVFLATNLTVANTDVRNCATLKIEVGSALDIGYNPGCNFGIVLNHTNGNGNFRLTTSSTSGSFYTFPSGDFTDYNVNQGSTEFYTTNGTPGAYFILPANVNSYGNLILSALQGSNVILPNNNSTTIYGDLSCRGSDADAWLAVTWNGAYGAILPKTVYVKGDLNVVSGSFIFIYNNAVAQNVIVDGDVYVAPGAGLDVYTNTTANTMSIGGSLINNSDYSLAPFGTRSFVRLLNGANKCDLTFFGSNSASITNTASTPTTIVNKVTINKGTSQAITLTIDIGGTLTTPTNNWLTLQNGTLRYMRTDPGTDFTITTTGTFTIPSTAGLYIDYPNNASNRNILIANSNVNTNDLYLNGKLTIIDGNVYVGRTNGTDNNNNDIEYSGGGDAEIEIQGGYLVVNGQIRRNPSTTNGILGYIQSGGDVVINGQAAITSNAKFEICNPGSVFNMSGGTLTIVRGGGTTYGDLYLRASSSTVTGGEIIFTQSPIIGPVVDLVQNYTLDADANVELYNLTINGKTAVTARNATVTLLINPLVINGDLTISNANSIFDANTNYDIDVTVKGGFTNNGTYNHYENLTTFSGGAQTIAGSSATTFYDLLVNPVTSLTLIRDVTVYNDLTLSSGQLLNSTFNINLEGDLINNANYDGDANQGGVILNGSVLQYISGTGTFGRLELANSAGARLNNDITLQKNLKLTTGVLDINDELLTLGVNSTIEGSSFGSSKMITSDGVFSNVGLSKYFDIYSGVAQTFTFPIGTSGKYTPAELTYTDNANVGYVRINNINNYHPGVLDPDNVLDYFWEVESNGIENFDGYLILNYIQGDVEVTGGNTEADYIAAGLLDPPLGTSWTKAAPGSGTDNVDESVNTIRFNFPSSDNLSGEFTCGIDAALPDEVPQFASNDDGNWNDPTKWDQVGGDSYTLTGGPNGFIVTISTDDTISIVENYAYAYRMTINGTLRIVYPYIGNNLGSVYGNGTLYLESATFPAGRYNDFFDCSNNSTLEYGGTLPTYTLVADLYSSIPNLYFTGTGTRVLPNKDLTICTRLLINGPTLDNSASNKKLTIQGTMERLSGAFTSGSGAGAIVSFNGSVAQTIGGALGDFTGANSFNYFEINNSAGLTVNAGGAIEVSGNLLLTSGNITTTSANTLTITNTAIDCVTPAGGSSSSYVDGPLIKNIPQGDNFLYPIGKGTELGNKITLSSTQTGTILWQAEYFSPNVTSTSFSAPLSYVNSQEYWSVSAPTGSEAIIELDWEPSSDLTPLMTQNGLTDMRVSYYNTGTTTWDEITSTAVGDDNNGTVSTSDRVTIPASGSDDYTIACINAIKPRARLNPSGPVCGGAGIPVSFTGVDATNLDFVLNYKMGGIAQVPVTVSALPYTLPTDATGTTYQLTGFTYNNPPHAGPITGGVVDPAIITTYTVPTTANAGLDQSLCGLTTTTLDGNEPLIGNGLWSIISGTGGTVVSPTIYNSTFNGTNGTTYELEWAITNGGCSSSDTVVIAFPILPVQPSPFTTSSANVCQGEQDVIYTVPNDPSVTYTWDYTGIGETITGTGNSVSVDFDVAATSGTLGVTATNGCGTSAARTIDITVNVRPTATLSVTAILDSICTGDNTEIVIDFTAGTGPFDFTITDGITPENLIGIAVDPYTYTPATAPIWIDDGSPDTDYFYTITTITDTNGCTNTGLGNEKVTVFKIPGTGPQYHIGNTIFQ